MHIFACALLSPTMFHNLKLVPLQLVCAAVIGKRHRVVHRWRSRDRVRAAAGSAGAHRHDHASERLHFALHKVLHLDLIANTRRPWPKRRAPADPLPAQRARERSAPATQPPPAASLLRDARNAVCAHPVAARELGLGAHLKANGALRFYELRSVVACSTYPVFIITARAIAVGLVFFIFVVRFTIIVLATPVNL